MLFNKQEIKFASISEGEANILLHIRNQELRAEVALRKGNGSGHSFHKNIAQYFRNTYNLGIHSTSLSSLVYTGAKSQQVNGIISKANKASKSAVDIPKSAVSTAFSNVNFNAQIDEFDPTNEQISACQNQANRQALEEELRNGRTFNAGTFDQSTQEVHPVGTNGRLVVILTANRIAREQRIYEDCYVKTVMENIVNKRITEAGNLVIYALMERDGNQINFNDKVRRRINKQKIWVSETAKATGLSNENIYLLLENSAININGETPAETFAKIAPLIVVDGTQNALNSPIVPTDGPNTTGLPPLGESGASSDAFGELIAKVAVFLINVIVNAIKKRRKEIFDDIPDPSVIAARCTDANIPLENCEGLPDDFLQDENTFSSGGLLLGVAAVGLGVAFLSNRENKPKEEKNKSLKTRKERRKKIFVE